MRKHSRRNDTHSRHLGKNVLVRDPVQVANIESQSLSSLTIDWDLFAGLSQGCVPRQGDSAFYAKAVFCACSGKFSAAEVFTRAKDLPKCRTQGRYQQFTIRRGINIQRDQKSLDRNLNFPATRAKAGHFSEISYASSQDHQPRAMRFYNTKTGITRQLDQKVCLSLLKLSVT